VAKANLRWSLQQNSDHSQEMTGHFCPPAEKIPKLPSAAPPRSICSKTTIILRENQEANHQPTTIFHPEIPATSGSVSKPCTPGEHQNSW